MCMRSMCVQSFCTLGSKFVPVRVGVKQSLHHDQYTACMIAAKLWYHFTAKTVSGTVVWLCQMQPVQL